MVTRPGEELCICGGVVDSGEVVGIRKLLKRSGDEVSFLSSLDQET